MKIKAPVTVHDGKQYVAPGTEIDLPEDQARRLIEVHGEWGGANRPQDPANTQTLNVIDEKSLADLNFQAEVNGGHGKDAPTLNKRANTITGDATRTSEREPLPSDSELEQMNKSELTELAQSRKVELEHNATKAEIISALKAK
jgi:hypothetical protein